MSLRGQAVEAVESGGEVSSMPPLRGVPVMPPQPVSADVEAITEPGRYQDLSLFKVPAGFRGRPGWYVQLWWVVHAMLFRPSPQIAYGWRRMLLRLFGAQVGVGAIIRPTVRVTYPWKVTIGDHAWIGDEVTLYSLGEISARKSGSPRMCLSRQA
jgi:putative colanic acid biosynthesis acetyltransferase WcaF